ncbi:MAG: hypothetical protein IKZ85_03585 [Pseudobutyrivibrio sp.]|nr:hypothetical protein [Pseudobutyrivibrio sp.]
MSALVWDRDNERLFETGVDHVVLYLMKDDGTYEDGIAWNGVTGITESPEGADANDIYADNIKYLSLISKEDWKGTIKAYTYPREFNACMGNHGFGTTTTSLGFKAQAGQQKRRKFALSWRSRLGNDTEGDSFAYKIHIAWGLSAAPSEMDHATQNDSPEAQEFSWEISSIPPQTAAKIHTNGDSSTSSANYTSIQPCAHVYVASKIVKFDGQTPAENTCLEALEDYLYGTNESAAGEGDDTPAKVPSITSLINGYASGSYT